MRELGDKRFNDKPITDKIVAFCKRPELVDFSKTAKIHLGLENIAAALVLEALQAHISNGYRAFVDRMDDQTEVYIVDNCMIDGRVHYVKVNFYFLDAVERMFVMSAHTPRKW